MGSPLQLLQTGADVGQFLIRQVPEPGGRPTVPSPNLLLPLLFAPAFARGEAAVRCSQR